MDLIQAAKQSNQSGEQMEETTRVAAEPVDPSGKPRRE
jgi:hypothetical protein